MWWTLLRPLLCLVGRLAIGCCAIWRRWSTCSKQVSLAAWFFICFLFFGLQGNCPPSCMVFLAFRKAYDRLSGPWVLNCTSKMGFGERACKWVSIMLENTSATAAFNGWQPSSFPEPSGVQQGSPLSPLLYVLAAQPLAAHLRHQAQQGVIRPITMSDGQPSQQQASPPQQQASPPACSQPIVEQQGVVPDDEPLLQTTWPLPAGCSWPTVERSLATLARLHLAPSSAAEGLGTPLPVASLPRADEPDAASPLAGKRRGPESTSDAESSETAEAPTADSVALVPLTPNDSHAHSFRRSSREHKKPRPYYVASQPEPPDKPSASKGLQRGFLK